VQIGPYHFDSPLILAPMAGVADRPFRNLCRRLGADYAVAEMVSCEPRWWASTKTRMRVDVSGESAPRVIQIAGAEPALLADCARRALDSGADIIDINMGCPAKKVCNRLAGSALLRDENLVARILAAVVAAVSVPVTLKMRTGWDPSSRNGVAIARLAQAAGIAAVSVHGRTRACAYRGAAEYSTLAAIKAAVDIQVIANGDIDSAHKCAAVLAASGADGAMIGRAACGNPWLFAAIKAARTGAAFETPTLDQRAALMLEHLDLLHAHYGAAGVRIARKHIGWYLAHLGPTAGACRARFNAIEDGARQRAFIAELAGEVASWRTAA
jgi:tRNA-dihydrouridine synthase B